MKKLLYAAMWVIVVVLSCRQPQTHQPLSTKDGVTIDYRVVGQGDTTILFLHGWGINQTYWDQQAAHFGKKYKAVSLDLPGFGKSGKNREAWTIENYAEDVAHAIKTLGLQNVILVGHSMSGSIVVETAVRFPSNIIGVIGVDNFKDVGHISLPEEKAGLDTFMHYLGVDFVGTITASAEGTLYSVQTDSTIRKRILNDVITGNAIVSKKVLNAVFSYGSKEVEMLKKLPYKLFLINSDNQPTETRVLSQIITHSCEVFTVHATSHYPMIENAEDFNRQLETIISKLK
ncbi:alpha/beta hydrolase [bacterium]|nr:alpha/beta hydrolase [bacterium]NUN44823.1 alpha/beta hydrolase [bacterium]